MTTSYIPAAVPRGASVKLKRGDTLGAVIEHFRRPLSDYHELVGANLHHELDVRGPRGLCATLAGLKEGQILFIPASWVAEPQSGLDGLGDELEHNLATLIPFNPQNPQGVTMAQYLEQLAVLAGWWRQEHPNELPTSMADLKPYVKAVGTWWNTYGSKLPQGVAKNIQWGAVNWPTLARWALAGFPLASLHAGPINALLAKSVAPGQFPRTDETPKWTQVDFSVLGKVLSPEAMASVPTLRWDLLPAEQIDIKQYKQGMDPTDFMVGQLNKLLGVTPSGDVSPGSPGGPKPTVCPKGASPVPGSCDCTLLGAGFVYDPTRNQCVNCGNNTTYDATTGDCLCNAGFVFTTDPKQIGCVAIPTNPDKTTVVVPPPEETPLWQKAAVVVGVAAASVAATLAFLKKK